MLLQYNIRLFKDKDKYTLFSLITSFGNFDGFTFSTTSVNNNSKIICYVTWFGKKAFGYSVYKSVNFYVVVTVTKNICWASKIESS